MNSIFQDVLRKFVLVFVDDILIYSTTWGKNLVHVQHVLGIFRSNNLKLKQTKCLFGQREVGYLGHVISYEEVKVDQTKISAISDWPEPLSVQAIQGFLGLSGYYRKFIQNYGTIAAPLVCLLNKWI